MGKVFNDEITKTDNEINKCNHCNRIFQFQCSLQKHMRIHSGERPYKCEEEGCNQTFSQVSNLIRHSRIHTGIKPYQCKVCKKSFTSSSNLKQHKNIHESTKNRAKLTCFINNCSKSYLYVCTLKKHIMLTHKKEYKIINETYDKINFSDVIQILKTEGVDKYEFVNFKHEEQSKESIKELGQLSDEQIKPSLNFDSANQIACVNKATNNNNNDSNVCNKLEQILLSNQQFNNMMQSSNPTHSINVNTNAFNNLNNCNLFPIFNIGNPMVGYILNNLPNMNYQDYYNFINHNHGMYNLSSNYQNKGSNNGIFPHDSSSFMESFRNLVNFMLMNPLNK